jgi:two-component system CheB/CheR fusion protein
VGVGASAGGLEAFRKLLQHLPKDTGMGFVLVQHLDPLHESALTQILARDSSLPVHEVTDNLRVRANHVHVIPPNTNLSIARGVLKLHTRKKAKAPQRSIDFFFESLAEDQKEMAIGVILSGTATDGTMGLEAIKAEGGITFAQDDSARYDSMPHSAIAAGCVDFVLSPEDIANELARIASHPYVLGHGAEKNDGAPLPSGRVAVPPPGETRTDEQDARSRGSAGETGFKRILLLMRNHSGVDFSLYKPSTIRRRITRRLVLSKKETLDAYAEFLRGNIKELDALYGDSLISVTGFFRNPEAFDVLKHKVFPKLLSQPGDDPIRVWVLGCSTGQEAYSLAMLFVECAENASRLRKLQVFATDLSDALLEKARHGLYSRSLAQDISPERLRRFFVEEGGGYRIVKPLREMVVFARQNLISDPPFSRMDLISCRNLLIYLEPTLQQKALPTFHYALKPGGFLFFGASESIGAFTDLFEPVDKKQKIYSRKQNSTPVIHLPLKRDRGPQRGDAVEGMPGPQRRMIETPDVGQAELSAQREADRVMVNQFAPPGVLINSDLQILQFRGPTSEYLVPPSGKATFDVLKMAREGLMLPLRTLINKARKENTAARKENVHIRQNGSTRAVNVEVIPLKNLREQCFLILFENEKRSARGKSAPPEAGQPRNAQKSAGVPKNEVRRSAQLESELAETRDYLQSVQEQHEAANEELQAANEEVQSANEELQSINEELETSKEELESANEELTTVNEEMAHRNFELSRLNADLNNLHVSVNMAIMVVTRELTIRQFTPPAERVFNLMAADVGRPLSAVRHGLVEASRNARGTPATSRNSVSFPLEDFLRETIDTLSVREQEVRDREGRWYALRVRPYMTLDNKVDGAVMVLVDISDLKRSESEVKAARNYAEATIRTAPYPLLVLRTDLTINTANESFYKTFAAEPGQTVGRSVFDLEGGAWNIPKLRMFLEDVLPRNSVFDDFELTHDFPRLGRRTMLLNARRLDLDDGTPRMILLAIEDITERQRAEVAIAALAAIVNSSDDAIIGTSQNGAITNWNGAAKRMFGYSEEEAVGQPMTMLIPPERLEEESEIVARLNRGERIEHFETIRLRKNRAPMDVAVTISPIIDGAGRVVGASQIARDITERKQVRSDLEKSNAELQSHIEELSRFNRVAVDRKLRMIELKKEINELCRRVGEGERYAEDFEREVDQIDR